ncbi:MAG: DUF1330 domain-containing protein [Burkholderia sp.]
MSAYWIAHVNVLDPEQYKGYTDLAPAAFKKYGAVFLARGGEAQVLEGADYQRHVVIRFDDMATALACYHSPEYQAAKAQRARAGVSEAQISIVEGLPA